MGLFIRSIFENSEDSEEEKEMHSQFIKFGRGEYKNKYLVDAKKRKGLFVIKTSNEYTNFIVKSCLEELKNKQGKIKASGVIVATFDISKEAVNYGLEIERVKQFMGIKQAVINSEINPSKILELMNKFPRAFYALSFSSDGIELKIKAKAPKSAKPSTKSPDGKDIKVDFCTLKTSKRKIVEEILFGIPLNFQELKIKHTLVIEKVELPKNLDLEKSNPGEIRENSKRKGKLIRETTVDGKTDRKEAGFVA